MCLETTKTFLMLLMMVHPAFTEAHYVGSEACAGCHQSIYEDFVRTGHAQFVHRMCGGAPIYPFSSLPGPPEGYAWTDISYVLGGFGWKARFLDREGYLITGERAQYNLATGRWAPFYPDLLPGTKRYDCAGCHATGWRESSEVHQDGLVGIPGTWALPGVQCEACHGAGQAHVEGERKEIVRDPSAELCGRCHYVNGRPRLESDGRLMQSDQYDQLIHSPHQTLTCVTCHDPHKSVRYKLGGVKMPTCAKCHPHRTVQVPEMAEQACESCHMPLASKSATESGPSGLGDMHSHTFRLSTDPNVRMFSKDGRFVRMDASGYAILKVEFACVGCHNGGAAPARSSEWMYEHAGRIHMKEGP